MERRGGGYRDNKRDRPPSFDRDRGGGGGGGGFNKRPRGPEVRFPESGAIALHANYFRLAIQQQTFKFAVKFEPEVENLRFRRSLLGSLDSIGEFIYDGTTLVLHRSGITGVARMETKSRDGTEYVIEITPKGPIQEDAPEIRWLQNVIFKKMLRTLNLSQIGRHYYEESKRIDLGRSHELWPGFIAAINEFNGGLFLNTDVTFKLLHKESVYQVIKQTRNQDQQRHALIGKIIMTKYNKKTYRVKDVDFKKSPKETFLRNGKEITFEQYYDTSYGLKIHDPNQPLIIATVRRKGFEDQDVSLIPELCFLTGIDDEMRSNFQFMKSLHEQTSKDPNTRMNVLTSFVENFSSPKGPRDSKLMKEIDSWKFSIDPTPLLITGRVTAERTVHFAQGETYTMEAPGDWTNFFRNPRLRFHEHKTLTTNQGNWMIVYERNTHRTVDEFIRNFKEVSEKLGLEGNKPDLHEISNDRPESYVSKIKEVCQDSKNKVPLVVCILNSKQASRYEAIKRLLTIEIPIPSQCIVATTLQNAKGLKSVCTKIAQQVNSKLGGRLWAIGDQLPVPAMIVGIDVTHKRSSNTSVAGFCASMDSWCGNWYSRALFQSLSDQSIIDGLNMCMRDALDTFKRKNGVLPQAIIIYRDGVGDSQIQTLLETEVENLKNAIRVIYDGLDLPRFQVVLVQKKINARFFYSEDINRPYYHNPPPGTVVDNTITMKDGYSEFFLISQKVNKGAVSPTRYVVIANLNGIDDPLLQDLTFKLCHLYYNWSATISVPAPIQYANKLANLVSQAVKATPDDSLSNYLYFL